jgi:hypothetical protein
MSITYIPSLSKSDIERLRRESGRSRMNVDGRSTTEDILGHQCLPLEWRGVGIDARYCCNLETALVYSNEVMTCNNNSPTFDTNHNNTSQAYERLRKCGMLVIGRSRDDSATARSSRYSRGCFCLHHVFESSWSDSVKLRARFVRLPRTTMSWSA